MTKSVAVMQPYLFPYIGYFCLVDASDCFVFYDDVNYIKRGWVNRNRILINNSPFTFTVPLKNASQFELIKNIEILELDKFRVKFQKQLEQSYGKASFFVNGMNYVKSVLESNATNIGQLAAKSITEFYRMIGIEKSFHFSSERFSESKGMDKAERLIDITKRLECLHYINAIGGTELYDKPYFKERGVDLSFVKPRLLEYKQVGAKEFAEGLSIIDVIMNNSVDQIKTHLRSYELI